MSEFIGNVKPTSVEHAETKTFSDGTNAKQTIPFFAKGANYSTANVSSSGNLVVEMTGSGGTVAVTQSTSPWVTSGTASVTQTTSPWVISGAVTCTQTTSPWVVNDTKNGITAYDTRTITRDGNGNVATILYKLGGVTQKTLTVTRDSNLNITNLAVS
jgi:hypothetical protein